MKAETDSNVLDKVCKAGMPVRIDSLALPMVGFDVFTFPRYRPLLSGTTQPDTAADRIAVGAWLGERPAGLAFYSRPYDEDRKRRLLSVMVSPLLRRQGIGARLLTLGEQLARERGAQSLTAIHSSQMPACAAFEGLLRHAGWSAPEEFEYRLAGKAGWALQAVQDWAPFLKRVAEGGYGSTPWTAVTEADRECIRHLVETQLPEADRTFNPLEVESKLELLPELSLVLRRHGEIVGWILGSRGALPGSAYYSHGYALPAVQRRGWLVAGVREVCERQSMHLGGESLSVFETAASNRSMRRFMERQLKPYSLWTDSRYLSEKSIAAAE